MTEFLAFIRAIDNQLAAFPSKLVGDKNIAIRDCLILVREAAKHAIEVEMPGHASVCRCNHSDASHEKFEGPCNIDDCQCMYFEAETKDEDARLADNVTGFLEHAEKHGLMMEDELQGKKP